MSLDDCMKDALIVAAKLEAVQSADDLTALEGEVIRTTENIEALGIPKLTSTARHMRQSYMEKLAIYQRLHSEVQDRPTNERVAGIIASIDQAYALMRRTSGAWDKGSAYHVAASRKFVAEEIMRLVNECRVFEQVIPELKPALDQWCIDNGYLPRALG